MRAAKWARSSSIARLCLFGIGLLMAVSFTLEYRTIREWRRNSRLLAERRTNEAAAVIATAIARDMRSVHSSVLMSPGWTACTTGRIAEPRAAVAAVFARYPYPELFFIRTAATPLQDTLFLTRSDRPPSWLPRSQAAMSRYPVQSVHEPRLARALADPLQAEIARRRDFATFAVEFAGRSYQVVTRMAYQDDYRMHLTAVCGFLVDLQWVRRNYFMPLLQQVARAGDMDSGLSFAILDAAGRPLPGSADIAAQDPVGRRVFEPSFVDTSAIPTPKTPSVNWSVLVSGAADPAFAAALLLSSRTLYIVTFATTILGIGLILTLRAVRASADLIDTRAEFVSSVTHELKTPIATIRAVGDTIASGRSPDKHREFAGLLVEESKRLGRLVDNLLAFARITDVADVYSMEPLFLDTLIDNTLKRFGHILQRARIDVQLQMPDSISPVTCDRAAIELVFDNIVDNAVCYSGESTTLVISLQQEGPFVVTRIRDQGRGIPPDELKKVTQKFFRGRDARPGGSGLGLAIVGRIVRDHGGRLVVDSVVGEGTTVAVSLPAAPSPQATLFTPEELPGTLPSEDATAEG